MRFCTLSSVSARLRIKDYSDITIPPELELDLTASASNKRMNNNIDHFFLCIRGSFEYPTLCWTITTRMIVINRRLGLNHKNAEQKGYR